MAIPRRHRTKVLASAAAVVTVVASVIAIAIRKKKERLVPRHRRAAITRPVLGRTRTAWSRLLNYGNACDFIVTINFTKSVLVDILLPHFHAVRMTELWRTLS